MARACSLAPGPREEHDAKPPAPSAPGRRSRPTSSAPSRNAPGCTTQPATASAVTSATRPTHDAPRLRTRGQARFRRGQPGPSRAVRRLREQDRHPGSRRKPNPNENWRRMTATAEIHRSGGRHRHPAQAARTWRHGSLAGPDRRALGQPDWIISRVMNGVIREVSPELRADVSALYDVWWCLRPPERTRPEKVAAAAARARAQRGRWCPGMGLDDELARSARLPAAGDGSGHGTGVATTRTRSESGQA